MRKARFMPLALSTFSAIALIFLSAPLCAEDLPSTPPEVVPTGYLKKLAVFPMETSKANVKSAENAWWKVREQLTDTKRFLVASKRFMVQKDVFQPRQRLQPSDVILLSQLIDADGLMTLQLNGRDLTFQMYSRLDGGILWSNTLQLHPSLPIDQQLEDAAVKLTRDFIASLPYHGFQILDPLINKPTYEEGDVRLAKADVGGNARVAEGDPVQWIRVERASGGALFPSGGKVEVLAEGQIVKNEGGVLLIEIRRVRDLALLTTNSLIRLPNEAEFLNSSFSIQNTKALSPELRYTPLPLNRPENEEVKPLVAALTTIANAAVFLLLAF